MSTITQAEIIDILRNKAGKFLTEEQIQYKAGLVEQILELKESMNALILSHNYMKPGLFYTVSDYRGDSLDLCRKAADTDKDYIVFCGVRFMAETAKLLNPGKIVLLPSEKAGCSLAAGITAEDVRTLRKQYPGVPVVTYVNTYADVKAESDICCTSSNAAAVVESLNSDTVIFLPDEYLAKNIAKETGLHIVFPSKNGRSCRGQDTNLDVQMIGWNARCEVHEKFMVEDIIRVRKQYPDTYVLAHPECSPEVVAASDYSGSTNQMIKAVEESDAQQYLLLTECAMGDNIAAAHPEKEMLRLCSVRCSHMNEITLENTLVALQKKQYEIDVPADIAYRARNTVERMIAIG
ncbi:MAG: quinolinate synthase NadA [Candidatus Marinimicrobia bacterium]|nr:quinolinate synthase NadA [Candidatus Neomarinimicrobiota bacterium]